MSPNVSGPKIVVSGPEKWLASGGSGLGLEAGLVLGGTRACRPEAAGRLSQLEARLATFREWPSALQQRPEELAEAGFYYTGFGDKVRCFRCQGELKKWSVGAVPMEEHRKMFKHCVAVK